MARFSVKLGNVLKQKMDAAGMTTSTLATKLNYTENDIERLLRGDLITPPEYIENICKVLNTSFSEVIRATVK